MEILIITIFSILAILIFWQLMNWTCDESFSKRNVIKSINNSKFDNRISPIVRLIYNEFLNNNREFHISNWTMNVSQLGLTVWSTNSIDNRIFYDVPFEILRKYEFSTKEELNNSLTRTDKVILDKICRRVEMNNKEFIDKVFITEQ